MRMVGGVVPERGTGVALTRPIGIMAVAVAGNLGRQNVMVNAFGMGGRRLAMRCRVAEGRQQQGQHHRQGDDERERPVSLPVRHAQFLGPVSLTKGFGNLVPRA